MLILIAFIFK